MTAFTAKASQTKSGKEEALKMIVNPGSGELPKTGRFLDIGVVRRGLTVRLWASAKDQAGGEGKEGLTNNHFGGEIEIIVRGEKKDLSFQA